MKSHIINPAVVADHQRASRTGIRAGVGIPVIHHRYGCVTPDQGRIVFQHGRIIVCISDERIFTDK